MKELSIEQKAKAYDEAIERAKEQLEGAKVFDYKEGQIAHDIHTTTYAIFPGLKESEDEKIRKEILHFIKKRDRSGCDYDYDKWIAWLEKQGKKETLCDKCRKEHPSHSCQDITALGRCALEKQDEQKTAWIEEDEDAIGMAIIALEDMYDEDAPNTTYGGYNLPFNKAAERLKSLKDRVIPQPKQEWSEEDDN